MPTRALSAGALAFGRFDLAGLVEGYGPDKEQPWSSKPGVGRRGNPSGDPFKPTDHRNRTHLEQFNNSWGRCGTWHEVKPSS